MTVKKGLIPASNKELFNLNPMLVHTCTAVESRKSTGHCKIIQGTVLGIVGTH